MVGAALFGYMVGLFVGAVFFHDALKEMAAVIRQAIRRYIFREVQVSLAVIRENDK